MQSFLSTFPKYVHLNDILVLAVSGGVDSMVMLDLVLQVHPRENMVVAHFDHSLRGAESDADMRLVHDYCRTIGVDFVSEKEDITSLAEQQKSSLEAVARHARYAFLERVRKETDATYILTAHHADDQVETMIMNLLKGGKFQGLSGIGQLSGHIFRPLLSETKADIYVYAEARHVPFREDASNEDTHFDRNKIRHQVVPVLMELNPSLHRTFGHLATHSEEVQEFLTHEADRWLQSEEKRLGKKHTFGGQEFEKVAPLMQREIVARLYRITHGGSAQGLSTSLIKEVIRFVTERSNSHGEKIIKNLHLDRRGDAIRVILSSKLGSDHTI